MPNEHNFTSLPTVASSTIAKNRSLTVKELKPKKKGAGKVALLIGGIGVIVTFIGLAIAVRVKRTHTAILKLILYDLLELVEKNESYLKLMAEAGKCLLKSEKLSIEKEEFESYAKLD